ncbi:Pumilio y domain member 6 [Entomophthora muscae]|uniref:Pumilio y domain member 6 n=1 Tax=Entomophthora muscae TaxID=34485 RepID=A0ACC2SA75_9FUNG|nr:Pumilio y domain member 6 [Entomophthora muscae]
MRNNNLAKEEQHKMVDDMISFLKGQVAELAFKHDASRIVQTCLKYGNQSHKDLIAKELSSHYLSLSRAKYGRFIIIKILKYCKAYRSSIIKEFYGNVRKLICHAQASVVLEEAYSQYADSTQKAFLVQEFFGAEFSLFKDGHENMTLAQILKESPNKKETIMKELLHTLSQTMDKHTINHSIVHRALMEYFQNADAAQIQDIIGQLKELAVEILHTREGADVTAKCLLHGSAKDRKAIVKSFKPFVAKIAKEQYGHVVLLQLFDVVDDTTLVDKNILGELIKNLGVLLNDKFGRRVVAYVLVGRSQKFISYATIQKLKEHDPIRAASSKKDPAVRSRELLQCFAQPLIDYIAEHASSIIRDPFPSQIMTDALLQPLGDKSKLIDAINSLIAQAGIENDHVLEHITANRVIKTLISFKDESGAAPYAPGILAAITPEGLLPRALSRGSFVVLALLESPTTGSEVRKYLLPNIKQLTGASDANKGTQLIAKKLSA